MGHESLCLCSWRDLPEIDEELFFRHMIGMVGVSNESPGMRDWLPIP